MLSRLKRARTGSNTSRPTRGPKLDDVRFDDPEHKKNFDRQQARGHLGTRWYCETTARALFMEDDIPEAFNNMGITSLLHMKYDTFPALVSEFLATLKVTIEDQGGEGDITFRLGNKEHTMGLREWCNAFTWRNWDGEFDAKRDYPMKGFWARITGQSSVPTGANIHENDIASPLFRVIKQYIIEFRTSTRARPASTGTSSLKP